MTKLFCGRLLFLVLIQGAFTTLLTSTPNQGLRMFEAPLLNAGNRLLPANTVMNIFCYFCSCVFPIDIANSKAYTPIVFNKKKSFQGRTFEYKHCANFSHIARAQNLPIKDVQKLQ